MMSPGFSLLKNALMTVLNLTNAPNNNKQISDLAPLRVHLSLESRSNSSDILY